MPLLKIQYREKVCLNMDYNVLKAGFIEYLERKNSDIQGQGQAESEDIKDVSIFSHSSEFKEYLKSQFDFNWSDSMASLSDILDMELIDGKLVDVNDMTDEEFTQYEKELEQKSMEIDNEEGIAETENIDDAPLVTEEIDESAPLNDDGTAPTKLNVTGEGLQNWANQNNVQIEGADFMADVLNDLLEDEDFKQAVIGGDPNGKVTSENLANFLNIVQCYDEQKGNLSLEDLMSATQDIQDGVFRNLTNEQIQNTVTENGQIGTPNADKAGLSSPSSKVTADSLGTPSSLPKKDKDGNSILSNMTKEELEKEKKTRQDKVKENKTNLSGIADGSNPTIKGLQENVDNSYDKFQETLKEIDEELAQKLDEKKQEIEAVEQQIASKDAEIASGEAALSQAQTNESNAQNTVSNLESNLSSLQASASGAQGEQKAAVQNNISQAQSQLEEAKQKQEEAKQATQEAQENLERLKEEKAALEEQLAALQNDPENGMAALEGQVSNLCETNPQLQTLKQNYDNSKEKLQQTQSQMTQQAKAELETSQQNLDEVNTALAKVNDQKDTQKLNPNGNIIEYAKQFLGLDEKGVERMLNNGVDFPDGLWCSAFATQMMKDSIGINNLPDWYLKANTNSCSEVYAAAQNNNAAFKDTQQAQAGDLIFFNTKRGNCRHTGIVTKVEDGYVYTIEGNTSGKVNERKYKITEGSRIFGFARVA